MNELAETTTLNLCQKQNLKKASSHLLSFTFPKNLTCQFVFIFCAVGGIRRVQIPRDICTRFARYLYPTKESWVITVLTRGFFTVFHLLIGVGFAYFLFMCTVLFFFLKDCTDSKYEILLTNVHAYCFVYKFQQFWLSLSNFVSKRILYFTNQIDDACRL